MLPQQMGGVRGLDGDLLVDQPPEHQVGLGTPAFGVGQPEHRGHCRLDLSIGERTVIDPGRPFDDLLDIVVAVADLVGHLLDGQAAQPDEFLQGVHSIRIPNMYDEKLFSAAIRLAAAFIANGDFRCAGVTREDMTPMLRVTDLITALYHVVETAKERIDADLTEKALADKHPA